MKEIRSNYISMIKLIEFRVNKSIWNDVKNDIEFRFGFEAEFHVRYAVELLKDQEGRLPDDFQSFNRQNYYNYNSREQEYHGAFNNYAPDQELDIIGLKKEDPEQLDYNKELVLEKLCRLFERYLGLPINAMGIMTPHSGISLESYQKWQLTFDESLNLQGGNNPDEDLGVELVSPVMTLREGLVWMNKIFQMIATFNFDGITLFTNARCGFHVNLSHIRMNPTTFDYAKLAILSGDEHYLQDFQRISNIYSQPLIQAVRAELSKAANPETYAIQQQNLQTAQNALGLLNLRGWSPQRVMTDLAALIPKEHHMSVDLRRLETYNPYIEIRIAGNAGYEQRFNEIAGLAIRFGALIKIACDPYAYREEYLKKIYQLVSGVATAQQPTVTQTTFPKIRIYLRPITDITTRKMLDMLENQSQTGAFTNTPFLILRVIRSAMATSGQDLRIRQGLLLLLEALKFPVANLQKAINNIQMLKGYGIIGPADKPVQITKVLSDFVRWLAAPAGRMPLMQSARPVEEPPKKKKPQLSEYEKRRLNEKQEKMDGAERERQLHRKLLSEYNERPHKKPVRYVA
jgi:hypothetical protein